MALTNGDTSPCAAASTAVAVVTGSEMASQSAAVASTATSTPTTPTRLRLKRALICERPSVQPGRIIRYFDARLGQRFRLNRRDAAMTAAYFTLSTDRQ